MTSKLVDRDDANQDVVDDLNDLLQLDCDAVAAYEIAIGKLRDVGARGDLVLFKQDHERHIEDLSRTVLRLGGTPKDRGDLKGILVDALTALRSASGDVGALRAIRMAERIVNRRYGSTLAHALSEDARAIVKAHRDDERHHLLEIRDHLERLDEDFQEEIDDEAQLLREDPEELEGEQPPMGY